ncbi:MFS transporter [Paraburkholderia nemoris]|uniref:Multidrug resistance protein MdtD n=1 Tax=Paraburkholderia nemoris TaxID=2793076 RepID=A0ABM8SHI8_9BURK|nr:MULTISPECIES: MFS transporter [Paraburkholderia]MBK3813139.1 MFS transporter [Paraburkholderia aspalathi]CAE6798428.1 Putative multidrug resistance protein MdtD [Paraburkholderia nemoris]CAE6809756.1 Putative multidrug resistance protein MdtD [Paraburkholderia nemoris]
MSRSRNAPPSYDEGSQAVIAEEHPSSLPDTRAADASSSDAAQPTTRFSISKNTLALGAVCLASLMFGLEISSVPVILPTLERVLHGDFKGMQWIMNAYTLGVTTVLMATGALADRFGRRRIFVIGIALFGLTSLICGFAQSVPTLIVARLLQGASGGAMLICQVAVLSHQFSEGPERVRAFSAWGIILGIGLGFGPIIGGMIVAVSGWQWVFWIHALLAAVTLTLVFGGVQESRDPHAHTLDVAGIVTLSLAVFGLTYYITQGSDLGFASLRAILILVATVVAFVAFLCAERLSARPMFDFSVFRIRKFSGALMGSAGMNFSFWPFMIYLPIYFQIGLGYDSVNAGLALLAYTLPTLLFPPLGERLALRYGSGIAIPAGLFTIGLGFMLMKYGSHVPHPGVWSMLPGCILAGAGLGLTNTPVTNTTTGAVPAERAGMASGIDMSARMITLAINIALMGAILVGGILVNLRARLPATLDTAPLGRLAEKIAAGDVEAVRRGIPALATLDPSGSAVHAALIDGFGWVMLYGGVGVWVLAALSFVISGSASRRLRKIETIPTRQSVRCDSC